VSAASFVVGVAGIVVVDMTLMAVVVAAVGGTVVVVGFVVVVVDSTIVVVSSADVVGPTTAVSHAFIRTYEYLLEGTGVLKLTDRTTTD